MKAFFKEYFNYSKRQNRAILFLLALIIIVFITPTLLNKYRDEKVFDYSEFESQLIQFETDIKTENTTPLPASVTYFNFDPNTINQQGLINLGMTSRQAQMLINYRKAGGTFKKADDLKKIYEINDSLYQSLKPFIKIENNETAEKIPNFNKNEYNKHNRGPIEYEIIELNTADSLDLIKLPRIGSVLARRIIEYRNFLGGYYQKDQLLEVFGLNAETFQSVCDYIRIDTTHIQKIDLNTVEFKTLNKHPYLTYANTKSLLKYRQLMGSFKSKEVILENHLVDSATYNKIKNYVVFN